MSWKKFGLSDMAAQFLDDFYHVLQAWDDFYDGDDMPRNQQLRAIWSSLFGIPANPFFREHADMLLPVIGSLVLKWESANELERNREKLDVAFVWRAGFFDVVLQCVMIERGPLEAMRLGPEIAKDYTETVESLREEFKNA